MSTKANYGSFDSPHFGGIDLVGAIARAKELLGEPTDLSHLNPNQRLAWLLLRDACRLASVVTHIVESTKGIERQVTSEAIEIIVRKVLEHTIFLEYLRDNKQDEALIKRFFDSCEVARERANKNFVPRTNWPNYEQMAATHPALHDVYRQYSYVAHPKTCYPYSYLESRSGKSPEEFFHIRSEHAVIDLAQILHFATDAAWAIGVESPK